MQIADEIRVICIPETSLKQYLKYSLSKYTVPLCILEVSALAYRLVT